MRFIAPFPYSLTRSTHTLLNPRATRFSQTSCVPAADESAFGSRQDKLVGCRLQRAAWDENTRLLTPIFTAISPPLPKHQRLRGELGAATKKQRDSSVLKRDQRQEADTERDARNAIEDAVVSEFAEENHY